MRRRLDAEMVRRGLAVTRSQAQTLIADRRVRVGGAPAPNPARQVDHAESVAVEPARSRYVGRGAEKLVAALDSFGLDPAGRRALDAGASTGGFTDALLQRGAAEVTALDVGRGQLHERLRSDARVVAMERTNLRHVDPEELGPFDVVVADLSFISLDAVMDVLVGCCDPHGWIVVLIKPQFEAPRDVVTSGHGVITDPADWARAIDRVRRSIASAGASLVALEVSPLRGAEGNVEFLAHVRPGVGPAGDVDATIVESVVTRAASQSAARAQVAPT